MPQNSPTREEQQRPTQTAATDTVSANVDGDSSPTEDLVHPAVHDAEYLPSRLEKRVLNAIDTAPSDDTKTATSFEPLAFDPPTGWTLETHVTGGNTDLAGHFERARWSHPFYCDITVESDAGEDTHRAYADDYSPFHTGSRYVAFVRATQHIAECTGIKHLGPMDLDRLIKKIERSGTLGDRIDRAKLCIDHWSDEYPEEAILRIVEDRLRAKGHYYASRKLTEYAKSHDDIKSHAAVVTNAD